MDTTTILLVASFAVAILIDFGFPIALAIFLARRFGGRWPHWMLGVLVFLVSQGLTRIPAMIWLQSQSWMVDALKQPAAFWAFLLFAAFTAGLFEEGGRWLAFRFAIPAKDRHWRTAVMVGAGHGGLESFGVGLAALAGCATYLAVRFFPDALPLTDEQLQEVSRQFGNMQGWEPLLGGFERAATQAVQIAFTVMVLLSFTKGARWWWYALAAHTFVDFTAVACLRLFSTSWKNQPWSGSMALVVTEILVAVFAIVSLWFIVAVYKAEQLDASPGDGGDAPPPTDAV
jgi:uncharacterized membrane protein YhfC